MKQVWQIGVKLNGSKTRSLHNFIKYSNFIQLKLCSQSRSIRHYKVALWIIWAFIEPGTQACILMSMIVINVIYLWYPLWLSCWMPNQIVNIPLHIQFKRQHIRPEAHKTNWEQDMWWFNTYLLVVPDSQRRFLKACLPGLLFSTKI